jgi:prevent-host-death family protein
MQVNMHQAKTRLSELAERVLKGEKVVIAKAGKPIVDLVPHVATKQPRIPGGYEIEIDIPSDFNQTPKKVIDDFYANE